jgi:pyridoxamine 5'-phosphate oxidase
MTFKNQLLEEQLSTDPFEQFQTWFRDASSQNLKYPDAMTLATSTSDGIPSARMVLFKGLNSRGICFYTNYESRKAQELIENPRAALVFYWSALDRQIRVEGSIEKVTEQESDDYWNSRPRDSRISALSSEQSQEVKSREELENRFFTLQKKYQDQPIPRPPHWGGFCLVPQRFEFWMEGAHRLHDRFCYSRSENTWKITRLSP